MQIAQIAQEERAERVPIGVFVDREQRDELVRLARDSDCSMSRIVGKLSAIPLGKRSMRLAGIEPATSRSGGARSIP